MTFLTIILQLSLLTLVTCQTCAFDTTKATLLTSPLSTPSRSISFDDLGFDDITGWQGGGSKVLNLSANGDSMRGTSDCVVWRGRWEATSWEGYTSWPAEEDTPGYYLGVDSTFDSCTISFTGSILAIVARINTYSSIDPQSLPGTLTAYDQSNVAQACVTLPVSAGGVNSYQYIGIQTKKGPISKVTLFGGESVMDNIQILACETGYTVQSGACVDYDECAEYASDCHYNALCENTPGSFNCICQGGTVGDGHGDEGCVDPPISAPVNQPISLEEPVSAPMNEPISPEPVSVPVATPVATPTSVPTTEPIEAPVPVPEATPVATPIAIPSSIPSVEPIEEPLPVPGPPMSIESPVARPVYSPIDVPVVPVSSRPIPTDGGSTSSATILGAFGCLLTLSVIIL